MMGCSCIYLEDMAAAFTLKGAATYLGWDGSVGLGFVDRATADLITNLCAKRMTVCLTLIKKVRCFSRLNH
jgi:hypothetical protein